MSDFMSRGSDRLRSPGEGPRQARPTTPGDHHAEVPAPQALPRRPGGAPSRAPDGPVGPRGRGGAHGLPQARQRAARGERRVRRCAGAHAGAHLGALRRPGRRASHHRRPAARDQRSRSGLVHDRRRVARARGRARGLRLLRARPGRGAAVRVDRRPGGHVRGALGRLTRRDRRADATAGRGRAARPARVAGDGRDPAARRRPPQRGRPSPPRGGDVRQAAAHRHRGGRRHPLPALLLLPPRPRARLPGGADPARRRRPRHPGDRRRLDQPGDLAVVLRVLYLVYTAGHAGRVDLAGEAIRLARQLTLATEEPEARGLLALMLLNHARLPARLDSEGRIVTLDRQDRGLWDTREIAEGVRLLQSALAVQRPGRYQIEAAIAALHDDAASAEETDWPQILAWYDDLVALTDDPVQQDPAAVLGRAVAVGHVVGAAAGLRETDRLREVLGDRHRWHAVRGYLYELDGDLPAAGAAYAEAARRATDVAERDHLVRQAAGARAGEPARTL